MTGSPTKWRAAAIDAGDREVLTAWANAGRTRLARRAWIVLEEAAGVQERRLAQATPLSSARVQALVAGYRQNGLLGLIDAPRSGRPKSVPAHALADAPRMPTLATPIPLPPNPGAPQHRDAMWRLAREQGLSIDRQRLRQMAWPAVANGPWAGVYGAAAGPNVSVLIVGPVRNDQPASGTWLYPELSALTHASTRGANLDWTVVLDALGKSGANPHKPRAVQERRSQLLRRVISKVKTLPAVDVLVGGDPLCAEFLSWLVSLRAVESKLGSRGPKLRIRGAASFTTWHNLLCDVLSASPDRSQVRCGEDERVAKSLWRPPSHFWWHRGRP